MMLRPLAVFALCAVACQKPGDAKVDAKADAKASGEGGVVGAGSSAAGGAAGGDPGSQECRVCVNPHGSRFSMNFSQVKKHGDTA